MSLLNDGVFWSGIAVLLVAAYKFTVSYCLKSRCEDFNCMFGLLKIRRDIKSEVEIEKIHATIDPHGSDIGYIENAVSNDGED